MSYTRRAMRLSLADALFYAFMVGAGEVYFLADAVRLGATALGLALVITLPLCVGTMGPVLSLGLLGRFQRRKAVVVSAATLQALVLFAIVASDATGALSPRVLIGLASAYQIFAQAAGTAWASWYGDLVPATVRGRYFATRNCIAQVPSTAGFSGQRKHGKPADASRRGRLELIGRSRCWLYRESS